MAAPAAEAAQRRVEQAALAFAAADREAAASMLRPLQQLLLALGKKGGAALQVSRNGLSCVCSSHCPILHSRQLGWTAVVHVGQHVHRLAAGKIVHTLDCIRAAHLNAMMAPTVAQEVVAGWAGYSVARQQDLFDAALLVSSEGDWGQLEGQLRLALDLTAGG